MALGFPKLPDLLGEIIGIRFRAPVPPRLRRAIRPARNSLQFHFAHISLLLNSRRVKQAVMQAPMCKICGAQHYRYDPHRFQAAPDRLHSNAQPQSPDRKDKPTSRPKSPNRSLVAEREAVPDKPDTAPSHPPLNIAALDDMALNSLRNLVMAEYMRRKRAHGRDLNEAAPSKSGSLPT